MGSRIQLIHLWAASGLGYLGDKAKNYTGRLEKTLNDSSSDVRAAAAWALDRMGESKKALPVLAKSLQSKNQFVRLEAINVLDEMGVRARPAIDAIRRATKNQPNKYIVRVAEHALNVLQEAK